MRKSSRLLLVPFLVLGVVAAACGDDDEDDDGAASTGSGATDTGGGGGDGGGITVFAATSLTEAFTEVGAAFAATDDGAPVEFSFDASSALVTQIIEGAPADVFASADTANMDKLTAEELNGTDPVVFATNLLTIIVPGRQPRRSHGSRRPGQPGPECGAVRRGGSVRQLRQPDPRLPPGSK